jgi:hypothetical protein
MSVANTCMSWWFAADCLGQHYGEAETYYNLHSSKSDSWPASPRPPLHWRQRTEKDCRASSSACWQPCRSPLTLASLLRGFLCFEDSLQHLSGACSCLEFCWRYGLVRFGPFSLTTGLQHAGLHLDLSLPKTLGPFVSCGHIDACSTCKEIGAVSSPFVQELPLINWVALSRGSGYNILL